MLNRTVIRIHPTVNIARLGTSEEYNLSPETSAGLPLLGSRTTGGLPIKPGTESMLIDSGDLRDAKGGLKRQAARFRLYVYELDGPDRYPSGGGSELVVGTRLQDGRLVKTITWTVHLANKKASAYVVRNSLGVEAYRGGVPAMRNPQEPGPIDSASRLHKLLIDPGPRAIAGANAGPIAFDRGTVASYSPGAGTVVPLPDYPKSFPADSYTLFAPSGPIDSLGELRTDAAGRLLVLGGFGRTAAQYGSDGAPIQMTGDLNNDCWFDDAADGPVAATVVFEDGTAQEAFGAWVICGPPAYAPQIRNAVSAWDDVYDTWIRMLGLQPEIYDSSTGSFDARYMPPFETAIRPLFRAAALLRWTTNLPRLALAAHETLDSITANDDPDRTIMAGLTFLRNPNQLAEERVGVPLMPLSLGDAGVRQNLLQRFACKHIHRMQPSPKLPLATSE